MDFSETLAKVLASWSFALAVKDFISIETLYFSLKIVVIEMRLSSVHTSKFKLFWSTGVF